MMASAANVGRRPHSAIVNAKARAKFREDKAGNYSYLTKYTRKNKHNFIKCESFKDDGLTDKFTVRTFLLRPHIQKSLNYACQKFSTSKMAMIATYTELVHAAKNIGGATANIAQATIARNIGVSIASVERAIHALRHIGLLVPEQRYTIDRKTSKPRRITSKTHLTGYLGWVTMMAKIVKNAFLPEDYEPLTIRAQKGTLLASGNQIVQFDLSTGEIFTDGCGYPPSSPGGCREKASSSGGLVA